MKWVIRYIHPVTGNMYYFLRFRDDGRPVGCMPLTYRKNGAHSFSSISAGFDAAKKMASSGYKVRFCPD